jgi:hypothetical protein
VNVQIKNKTSAKLAAKSSIKMAALAKSTSTTSRPGILMRGWFKYMKINASADTQDFRINPE